MVAGTCSLAALAGCLADADGADSSPSATEPPASSTASPTTTSRTPTATEASTPTTPTTTPGDAERIMVALHNDRAASVTLAVTVTRDDETRLDAERALPSGGYEALFSGIREVGEYGLRVETDDGVAESWPVPVDDYDVRMGSNLVVWASDGGLEMGMEA